MTELASQTVHAVAQEINTTLADARVALEAFVEQPGNVQLMERCRTNLHEVQGVLRMLEIYGAALLAEEMEQVTAYLEVPAAERKNQSEALDALMRAMVQLPSYLERVLAGGRDLALVLLPLLNDLRAVRGSSLLSEGTLLLLNLKSDRQAQPMAPAQGEPPLSAAQWARRLRSQFQMGLIGWIKSERLDTNLEMLSSVAMRLEQVATTQPVFQLWWVIGALLEALRENGIEGGISVKRLLGLADREIKRLYEQGEVRYAQRPAVELLNNVLYYIARATSNGPRVSSVRASFRLQELLPADETIEQERENLSAPSIKLMHTVAAAIREDLGRVKDVLDIYVRRGGGAAEELMPQVSMLKKIGDTLGVLGLGELRGRIQEATARLDAVASRQEPDGEQQLVQIAAILIQVEDRLDDHLVGQILPRRKPVDALTEVDVPDQDFRQVQSAVLRECVVNLARVKEYIAQNASGTLDASGFDNWPDLMRGIKAGLLMIGKVRAVDTVEGISSHLKRVMQPGGSNLPPEYLERLADAIVSVEYYIETLQAGRADPWYMLDNAKSCLDTLSDTPELKLPVVPPVNEAAPTPPRSALLPTTVDDTDMHQMPRPILEPPVLGAAPGTAAHAATVPDPELTALFVEEAAEEATKIRQQFDTWQANPLAMEQLMSMRRAFHTLKGSGRMVGARQVSEFSWAMENLLNRVLDGTVPRSPAVLDTLRAAVQELPTLVEDLAHDRASAPESTQLAARAHALASGRDDGTAGAAVAAAIATRSSTMTAATRLTDGGAVAPGTGWTDALLKDAKPEKPDVALRDIYVRETSSHVASVRAWIARESRSAAPHVIPEEVYRACHTLAGSSTMAEVRHGIRLADPVNHWLRKSFDTGVGLDDSDLVLLADCMTAMEFVAGHLDEGTGVFVAHDVLRARIARAEVELDRRITEASADLTRSGLHNIDAGLPEVAPVPEPVMHTSANVPHAAAATAEPDSAAEAALDYDPEIAGIFCEEAVELLDNSQAAMTAWNAAPDNGAQVGALRRPLHTLKGGARMAGITAMGEMAHELESLINRIEHGTATGDHGARQVAQQALDELSRMREAVVAGKPVRAMPALIEQIRSAGTEAAQAAAAPPPPVPEPASEPAAIKVPEAVIEPTPQVTMAVEPTAVVTPDTDTVPAAVAAAAVAADIETGGATMKLPSLEPMALGDQVPLVVPPVDATTRIPVIHAADVPPPDVPEPSIGFEAASGAAEEATADVTTPAAAPLPPGREPMVAGERVEMARVSAELLDQLLNSAGEVSIARARMEQQLGAIDFNLGELSRTVTRLKEQLRRMEIETEAQILNRREHEPDHRAAFDPLELDRYSSIQQYSRALAETANDVASIQGLLQNLIADAHNRLQQQSRTVAELQNGLLRARMVSFQRHVQRLSRIVRQAALDSGKRAELIVEGASGELDRQVLERMLPPFEHLLRNAVVHGIEAPEQRRALGKPEAGQIRMVLKREGAEVIVEVADDGAGMNLAAIRARGQQQGLIGPDQHLSDEDLMQLILEPGFSTASSLTQTAGRGVGMDVVAVEVKKLGGALHMESQAGHGARFVIRLPFTLAISHALVVRTGEEFYALPLPTVEGVVRLRPDEVAAHLRADSATFSYGGQKYRIQPLSLYVGLEPSPIAETDGTIPIVLVRAGDHSTGLVADELVGSREIVVKPVGPQISRIRGISGATILSDGRVVIILDIGALVRGGWRHRSSTLVAREKVDERPLVLVVDDSITVRRVTQRLLERNNMRVLTARDGMDAVTMLAEQIPDIILMDIEMPRMDGYELAEHVRNDPRTKAIPIIMITSRVGEKHRARAISVGVNDYLGKPYQESELLQAIAPLVAKRGHQVAPT